MSRPILIASAQLLRSIPIVRPVARRLYYAVRQTTKVSRARFVQVRADLRTRRERSAKAVTRHNSRRAYNRLYGSPDLLADYLQPARIRFYQEVAAECRSLRPRTVLDAGCGSGNLVAALSTAFDRSPAFTGIDYSRKAIDRARDLLPEERWIVGDLYKLPSLVPAETFDLICCTEVLEHLQQPERALNVLVRTLARNGVLVVTVPDGAMDDWEGHENFWTEDDFRRFLSCFGRAEVKRIDSGRTLLGLLRPV